MGAIGRTFCAAPLQHLMRRRSASTTRIYINEIERMWRQGSGAVANAPAILKPGAAS